jgi:hypothetical protein
MKGRQRGRNGSGKPCSATAFIRQGESGTARCALCSAHTPDRKSEIGPARSRAQKSPVRCPPKRGFKSTGAEVGGKGLPHGSQRSNFQERSLPNEKPVLNGLRCPKARPVSRALIYGVQHRRPANALRAPSPYSQNLYALSGWDPATQQSGG